MLLFNNRYGEYDKNVNNNYNNINEFRGVDLSISYKNKYENYLKQQKLEKERYAKYLLDQQKYQEMKRLQMIRDKKRQDLLDFFYSCLQKLYQYGTSYTNTLDLNWKTFKHGVEVQIANRDLQVLFDIVILNYR